MTSAGRLGWLHTREGLTIDVVYRFIAAIALSPLLAAAVTVYTLSKSLHISQVWSTLKQDRSTQACLLWLGVTLVLLVNARLNQWARNNWTNSKISGLRKGDVVVVTGGAFFRTVA